MGRVTSRIVVQISSPSSSSSFNSHTLYVVVWIPNIHRSLDSVYCLVIYIAFTVYTDNSINQSKSRSQISNMLVKYVPIYHVVWCMHSVLSLWRSVTVNCWESSGPPHLVHLVSYAAAQFPTNDKKTPKTHEKSFNIGFSRKPFT